MTATSAGERQPPKEKGRVTLSVRSPLVTSLLAGLGIEKAYINEVHAFAKRLERDRNRWDIERRRRGLFGTLLLTPRDAERALRLALAELGGAE